MLDPAKPLAARGVELFQAGVSLLGWAIKSGVRS